jgi:hypothetical protein
MILFSGDSFSAFDDDESWTCVFAKELGLGTKNLSIGGSSLWIAFNQIDTQEDYKIFNGYYNYMVITCTNYRRIPFCNNPRLCSYFGQSDTNVLNPQQLKNSIAHTNYYDNFFSDKMHYFLYERILEFIITKYSKHTKIILLPCFPDSLESIKQTNNIWHEDFIYLNFPLIDLHIPDEDAKNHFDLITNKTFGKLLAEKVKETEFGPLDFTLKQIKEAIK